MNEDVGQESQFLKDRNPLRVNLRYSTPALEVDHDCVLTDEKKSVIDFAWNHYCKYQTFAAAIAVISEEYIRRANVLVQKDGSTIQSLILNSIGAKLYGIATVCTANNFSELYTIIHRGCGNIRIVPEEGKCDTDFMLYFAHGIRLKLESGRIALTEDECRTMFDSLYLHKWIRQHEATILDFDELLGVIKDKCRNV